ncbi:MAG: DUF1552 domain-containing protein [Acidobacteria bacterium]|nr:DUF1552 domain-containing protein [Acidobacteriota bacterium]MDA1234003.1 DUF1552 domain-containing protein [Acidobacteriota bacterium]
MKKLNLTRRSVLQGVGATLALPWLEAMTPAAHAAGGKPPVRMAAMFMANGVRQDMWTPAGEGGDFQRSPTLEPLAGLKSELTVLTNLWNQGSKGGEGHYVKTSGLLTCTTVTKTVGVDLNCNGVSMDQVAAQQRGKETPLPSLELACAPVSTGVDKNVGYTRVYGSHVSWSGPNTPLARETDPRLAYERLFRASQPGHGSSKRDLLLLDRVLEDAKDLRKQVGVDDRRRVDEYFTVVRSLEERLERASEPERMAWKPRADFDPSAKPEGKPDAHADHVRLMLDIIAVAFQTDTTRIATFMFGNSVSNQNFSFLDGVEGSHHSISHHQDDPDKLRQYQLINRWHVAQYAYLLQRLSEMKEGESSVLDNSMILFASGLRDGNSHNPHNLPLLLGGRGGGRIDSGRHLVYSKDSPLANLYVSMLDAFGTPLERFADSTGPLPGLLTS